MIPTKRELYTSFVMRARAMAISAGTRAQNVPVKTIKKYLLMKVIYIRR